MKVLWRQWLDLLSSQFNPLYLVSRLSHYRHLMNRWLNSCLSSLSKVHQNQIIIREASMHRAHTRWDNLPGTVMLGSLNLCSFLRMPATSSVVIHQSVQCIGNSPSQTRCLRQAQVLVPTVNMISILLLWGAGWSWSQIGSPSSLRHFCLELSSIKNILLDQNSWH